MSFDPLLPAWAILLAGLAGAASLVAAYRRPCLAGILRGAAIALLVVMLANPVTRSPLAAPAPGCTAVVIDGSGSMALEDHEGRSRFAAASALAGELAGVLRRRGEVRVLDLRDAELHAPRALPAGDTDFDGLAALAGGPDRPQAIFLLSDGADWSGSDPDSVLARAGVPVSTVGFGSAVPPSNATVQLGASAATVAPGSQVPLTLTVSATPDLVGRSARLTVSAEDGATLLDETLALGAITVRRLLPDAGTAPGTRLWHARLDLAGSQHSREDDRAWCVVQVVDDRIRLLAVEGRPGWDTTFALRAWRRDRRYEVSSLHAIGARRRIAGAVPALPLGEDSLAGVGVLVLGQGTAALLGPDAAARIAAFVERGGGLLLLGPGPHDLPGLADLDPIEFTAGAPGEARLDAAACALPGMLPEGAAVGVVAGATSGLKPHARLLIGTRSRPLLAVRRHGAGWVCSAAFAGLWRWQLKPDAGDAARAAAGADAGERLWRQVLQACVGSPRGPIVAERTEVAVGEEAVAWLDPDRDPAVPVELLRPDGSRSVVLPHGDRVAVRTDGPGLWRFRRGDDATAVVALSRSRELLAPGRDDARLARLARATGGTACADGAAALAEAERIAAAPSLEPAGERVSPWITSAGWFLLALALLGGEWYARRRRMGVV